MPEWQNVEPSIAATLLSEAQRLHADPAAIPTATDWMQFRLTGDRIGYESLFTKLQDRLAAAALAACVSQDDGAKADWTRLAADDAWALCEMNSWCLPAHYARGARRSDPELPEIDDPVLDLDAGFTGALLSWASMLLDERWRDEFPTVLDRARKEVRDRVIAPFLSRTHWWSGSAEAPPNNWAPWITANALACTLVNGSAEEQSDAVQVSLPILSNFRSGYGADGSCEEGPTYWWWAALTLFEALDYIRIMTDGNLDQLGSAPVPAMAAFPNQMQIHQLWQVNFGDASAAVNQSERFHTAHRYALAVGDEAAALYARSMADVCAQTDPQRWAFPQAIGRSFHRVVLELLDSEWFTSAPPAEPPMPYPATTYHPSTGVLCARETSGSSEGLFLAIKAGHNGVSHNHNDAGNFVVFSDGVPVIIDVGVETYRRETFDLDLRYSIWTMRSSFHNVPIVNNQEQLPGRTFAATQVSCWGASTHGAPAAQTGLGMSLHGAYEPIDGLESWTRSAQLDRSRAEIQIRDSWLGKDVRPEFVLMLAQEPYGFTTSSFRVGQTFIGYSEGWQASFEQIGVDDPRLTAVWGPNVYRALICPTPGHETNASGHHQLTVSSVR